MSQIASNIYIISAPSGAGKSSLINFVSKRKILRKLKISVSYTTRGPRPGETHGKDYFFINHKEFKDMVFQNKFLEYAKVLGNYYGTSLKNIQNSLALGEDIIVDIDWQGARQIREKISEACSIFVLPPSKIELARRLRKRKQDSKKSISQRISQAVKDMSHYYEYEYVIINDDFKQAANDLKNILCSRRLFTRFQTMKYRYLIRNLLAD